MTSLWKHCYTTYKEYRCYTFIKNNITIFAMTVINYLSLNQNLPNTDLNFEYVLYVHNPALPFTHLGIYLNFIYRWNPIIVIYKSQRIKLITIILQKYTPWLFVKVFSDYYDTIYNCQVVNILMILTCCVSATLLLSDFLYQCKVESRDVWSEQLLLHYKSIRGILKMMFHIFWIF